MVEIPEPSFPAAMYWDLAAVEGFATAGDWVRWADRLMLAPGAPPEWLIGMSLAKTYSALREALRPRSDQELAHCRAIPTGNAILGYLFLRYRRGEFGFSQLLLDAGRVSDSGPTTVDCEAFYRRLTDLERAETEEERESIQSEAIEFFRPFRDEADRQWRALQAVVEE